MAHLIAPPSSVQPMTKEDVAVVQAEKRVDAATREQLVKVYGDSRDPHGRHVPLTRPPHRFWKCPACGRQSTDLRHVCGFCLRPEPGYEVNAARRLGGSTAAAPLAAVQRPGTSRDAGVRLVHVAHTKRTYRVFTEPHVPVGKSKAAAGAGDASHRHGVAGGGGVGDAGAAVAAAAAAPGAAGDDDDEEGEDTLWDDEPSCKPGGCAAQPGAEDDVEDSEDGAAQQQQQQRRRAEEEQDNGNFTHFIAIPFGKLPVITANATSLLEDLRSFVGAGGEGEGDAEATAAASSSAAGKSSATPDLVTSVSKLHMTLLLLSLPRLEDVEFANELLHGPFATAWAATKAKWAAAGASAQDKTRLLSGDATQAPLHRHPLARLAGGLQVMRAGHNNELYHPEAASVVYIGLDAAAGAAAVQELQRVLHESFAELIHDPEEAARSRRVLHVTIMNKKWRRGRTARRPFDARPIVDAFGEACIGAGEDGSRAFEIPELELCSMRRTDAETGTYLVEATVKI